MLDKNDKDEIINFLKENLFKIRDISKKYEEMHSYYSHYDVKEAVDMFQSIIDIIDHTLIDVSF